MAGNKAGSKFFLFGIDDKFCPAESIKQPEYAKAEMVLKGRMFFPFGVIENGLRLEKQNAFRRFGDCDELEKGVVNSVPARTGNFTTS